MSEGRSSGQAAGRIVLSVGRGIARRLGLRRQQSHSPRPRDWAIGMFAGDSPLRLVPLHGGRTPSLTWSDVSDTPSGIIADPFMIRLSGAWYMFFEVMERPHGRGQIGLAVSRDGIDWRYQQIVLAEPFHLSYPYVFEWAGDIFMIPETHHDRSVCLYRASPFPVRWSPVGRLLEGAVFSDSSIVRYRDTWWLFTETSPGTFDELRLFYAGELRGPWREHPASPLVQRDPRRARPAGRILALGDGLLRFAQDCHPVYGSAVRAFEVTDLTASRYQEREAADRPVLGGSGTGWNAGGMHHVDAHRLDDGRWLACVDGWAWPSGRRP